VFDADRPIINSSQDRLNRAVFAKALARCMLDHQDPASLVVGLYGGWGVGKTSVINLTVEELNAATSNMLDEDKPVILNFSAWSYSGQDQLIYSFFRRLSSALRNVPYLENSNRIIHLLELYVSFFTHKPVPRSLRTKRSLWEKITFQGREEVYAWESGRDLTLVKAELNELLRKQKRKIIIIIDNISRLYDDEIRQIFQIVKSMGDYVNTTYLLAFDKEQVIRALNHFDEQSGEAFVEKIVQLPFEIPPIEQQSLENIFADRLQEVIAIVPEEAWNVEYWADIYYGSLKYFFENCRDITRYVNTLNFSYYRLKDVVNPIDYFALTALEVFMPDVYFGIRDNKDLFTDLLDNVYKLDSHQIAKDKLRCDEIISRSSRLSHDILLDLLMNLFPRIRRIYHPEIAFYHSDSMARKLRRLCSPDLFDLYFRLSIQIVKIPQSEFETLLSLSYDEQTFDQALARLNKDERIIEFLDLLDSKIIQSIPQSNVQAIVSALLDNGDLFPIGRNSSLSLDTPMRIHRIIHRLLHRLPAKEDRFLCLQKAITSISKSLFTAVHELREQGREHAEEMDSYQPLEFRDLAPDQLDALQKLLVARIEAWAKNGSLTDHPRLLPILYAWRDWGNEEDCKQFVKQMTNTDKGLVAFLMATLDKAIDEAMTKYEKNPVWEQYLKDINNFVPSHALSDHAKIVFEDPYFEKLREREQLALMIFLDLINAITTKTIPKTSS
jgi:predicted KAP-like P-loop ATPase